MLGKKDILKRCKEIIKKGEMVLKSGDFSIKNREIMNINASIDNIYNLLYPKGIPYHLDTKNLKDVMINMGYTPSQYSSTGIFSFTLERFKGFTEDLEKGIINTISNIISLDLFNDLLDQSTELRKYHTESLNRASCVLARIVLEDSLNKICENKGVTPINKKASQANIALKSANVYSKTEFKLVDAWLSIGNSAAHPDESFKLISEAQMDEMIKGIKDFTLNHLK